MGGSFGTSMPSCAPWSFSSSTAQSTVADYVALLIARYDQRTMTKMRIMVSRHSVFYSRCSPRWPLASFETKVWKAIK
jgi:hypothetical protein